MAAIVVTFNGSEIQTLMRGPSGAVMIDLHRRANNILNAARIGCPVDQGALRGSLHSEPVTIDGNPGYRIGSPLEYAVYVHEGTGIYGKGAPITPKSKPMLAWPAKNQSGEGNRRYEGGETAGYIFAKQVAGMPGRPFLLNALQAGA
jgi:hypothetical protein